MKIPCCVLLSFPLLLCPSALVCNMYEVMLAHRLPRNDGRVVIVDSHKRMTSQEAASFHHPVYHELIRRVFSSGHDVTTLGIYIDEKTREGQDQEKVPGKKKSCHGGRPAPR